MKLTKNILTAFAILLSGSTLAMQQPQKENGEGPAMSEQKMFFAGNSGVCPECEKEVQAWTMGNYVDHLRDEHRGIIDALSSEGDNRVIMYRVPSMSPPKAPPIMPRDLFQLAADVWVFGFSPDGAILIGEEGLDIKIWDGDNGELIQTFAGQAPSARKRVMSPNGRMFVIANQIGEIWLWNVGSGKRIRKLGGFAGFGLTFSPSGRILAYSHGKNTVRLWDVASEKVIRDLFGHHDGKVNDVSFRPDGRALASCSEDGSIKLWNIDGQELGTMPGHKGGALALTFNHDGSMLASGGDDATVKLWDVKSGREIRTMLGHAKPVVQVIFSPDGHMLATRDSGGDARLWNVESGELIYLPPGHPGGVVRSISFGSDGGTLVTIGAYDKTVKQWNLSDLKHNKPASKL